MKIVRWTRAMPAPGRCSGCCGLLAGKKDSGPRARLEVREVGDEPAVSRATRVRISQGSTTTRTDEAADPLPASAWQRQSAGPGAKGPRAVVGTRWCIEECFQAARGQVGLDHYQVRNWTARHPARHPGHAGPRFPGGGSRRREAGQTRRPEPPVAEWLLSLARNTRT
ncbi:hypothetical protein [Streptomyces nojiriensis]|uniref:hypothetical protein n=1 Tax=Streptomyces nojiriensis TaxID=66374 RepID=UPI00369D5631